MGARLNTALSRVLSQWVNSPRYRDLLTVVVTEIEETDDLLADLLTKRWLDTAEGVWLDEVGEIIGMPRPYVEDDGPWFTYKDAYPGVDDPDLAYSGLPAPPLGGMYQSVNGVFLDELMGDDDYRKLIKAKAKATGSAGTLKDVYILISGAFDTESVVSIGGRRLVHVTTTTPLTPGQKVQLRKWAPINAAIDLRILN